MPGLLAADRFAVGAEVLHVVEVDAGDDGAVGIDDVDRVEPPAQADFEDRHVERRRGQQAHDRQRRELEIGERHVLARRFDALEVRHQRVGLARSRRRCGSAPRSARGAAWCRARCDSRPAAAIDSSIAQVEPLPLVPATVITGQCEAQPHALRDRAARGRAPARWSSGAGARSARANRPEFSCRALSQYYDALMTHRPSTASRTATPSRRPARGSTDNGVDYSFHDFRKDGVPRSAAGRWIAGLGWEKLVNRKGTTWRKLDAATQSGVTDAASRASADAAKTQRDQAAGR